MEYIEFQTRGTNCFPVAVYNCFIFLGLTPPSIDYMTDLAKCIKYKRTIFKDRFLKYFKELHLEKVKNMEVLKTAGIIRLTWPNNGKNCYGKYHTFFIRYEHDNIFKMYNSSIQHDKTELNGVKHLDDTTFKIVDQNKFNSFYSLNKMMGWRLIY